VDNLLADIKLTHSHIAGSAAETARWIAHGHLGSNGLWTAVGSVLLGEQVPAKVAQSVATGQQDNKMRIGAEVWGDQVKSGLLILPPSFLTWIDQ
jgi:hypothetical protein